MVYLSDSSVVSECSQLYAISKRSAHVGKIPMFPMYWRGMMEGYVVMDELWACSVHYD